MEINRPSGGDSFLATQTEEYLKRYNDTTTLVAEMLEGQMRSSFEFSFDGQDLISAEGSSMKQVFQSALESAEEMAKYDPWLEFEEVRRQKELEEFRLMIDMASGKLPNTMVVISETPAEILAMGHNLAGYNTKRQKAMLRIISRLPSGKIQVESQSLDRNDADGFRNIYHKFGAEPNLTQSLLGQRIHLDLDPDEQASLADTLTSTYDEALSDKYGGQWYAGRSQADKRNTYDFVRAQADVIDEFVMNHTGGDMIDKDIYNLVAFIEKRFKGEEINYYGGSASLADTIEAVGNEAWQAGKSYYGCGVSLSAGNSNSMASILESLGYGNKYKKMNCPFCSATQYGDPCASRISCSDCEAEVRDGKVINEGNGGKRKERTKKLGKKALSKSESNKSDFLTKLFGGA